MKLSRHLRTLIAHTLCLCLLSGFILGSTIVAAAASIDSAGSGGAAYPVPPEIESGNCILIDAGFNFRPTQASYCMRKTVMKNAILPA